MPPEQGDDGPGPVGQERESVIEVSAAYYIRIRGEVSGPFPRGLLVRYRVLGRLGARDEVSPDRVVWEPVEQCPAMALSEIPLTPCACDEAEASAWREERRRARLRWIDERTGDRRAAGRPNGTEPPRTGGDRRAAPQTVVRIHEPPDPREQTRQIRHLLLVLGALFVAALMGAALWWLVPSHTPRVQLLRHSALHPPAAAPTDPSLHHPATDRDAA